MKQWPLATSGHPVLTGSPAQDFNILDNSDILPLSPFVFKFARVDFYCFQPRIPNGGGTDTYKEISSSIFPRTAFLGMM